MQRSSKSTASRWKAARSSASRSKIRPTRRGLPAIVHRSPVPIVADIHYDHKMALAAIEAGVAKLRLNPGNIRDPKKGRGSRRCRQSARHSDSRRREHGFARCRPGKDRSVILPRRWCSPRCVTSRYSKSTGTRDIAISLKAHDVATTVDAYRMMDARLRERETPYALHLGITEAGLLRDGTIKSSIGLGILLWEGIGDTIRVSLADDPIEEVPVCWGILKSLGLREKGFEITACPSCGRAEISVLELGRAVEAIAKSYSAPVKVAVMGCVVNGPGESKMADVGVAGGKGKGAIYRGGELVGTYPESELLGHAATWRSKRSSPRSIRPISKKSAERSYDRARRRSSTGRWVCGGSRWSRLPRSSISVLLAFSRPIVMLVDGERVDSDVAPVTTASEKAFVPLRSIADALGAETELDAKTGGVDVVLGGQSLRVRVGDTHATLNGMPFTLKHAPFRVRGRVMISLDAVARALARAREVRPAKRTHRGDDARRRPGAQSCEGAAAQ